MENQNKATKGMNSHVLLTLIFILNIVLFISCFKQSFKAELEPSIFYIYLGVATLYVVFSCVDNQINKNKFYVYKIVMAVINVLLFIGLVIVFNL